ncbi:MAG: hypothetical protein CK552_00980 [Actinobacteria bacterium]|nr:MAG: hypothetical protein CK552_00980 [Actinomycetota bacterium]
MWTLGDPTKAFPVTHARSCALGQLLVKPEVLRQGKFAFFGRCPTGQLIASRSGVPNPSLEVNAPVSSAPSDRLTLGVGWVRPGVAGIGGTLNPSLTSGEIICCEGNEEQHPSPPPTPKSQLTCHDSHWCGNTSYGQLTFFT